MNKSLLTRIREYLTPPLDSTAGTGRLDEQQHAMIFALFQVLTWDENFSEEQHRAYVDERTEEEPGRLSEYRRGIELLQETTGKLFPGRSFPGLSLEERDSVVSKILRRFPHRQRETAWRRKLRLTSENLDIIFGSSRCRRFRVHVVRDLLTLYYTSAEGWAVVGYHDEFAGTVKSESEPCQVRGFTVEGDEIALELSDSTFERLDPAALELDDEYGLAVHIKAGRQRATFTRGSYGSFCEEVLREDDEGFCIKVGGQLVPVLRVSEEG